MMKGENLYEQQNNMGDFCDWREALGWCKGGNILSVKNNGATVKNYGYTDTEWKDKLTTFNGQTITYDAIGNPLQ